jgi:hypothetical protein
MRGRTRPRRSLQLLPKAPEMRCNTGIEDVICAAAAPRRSLANYAIISARGEVAEWSKAPDSKSGIRQRIVGSNPILSAKTYGLAHWLTDRDGRVIGSNLALLASRQPYGGVELPKTVDAIGRDRRVRVAAERLKFPI